MPVYEYKCRNCNKSFSIFFSGYNTGDVICPDCTSKDVKKCISNIMIVKTGEETNGHSYSSSKSCGSCASGNCSNCGSN